MVCFMPHCARAFHGLWFQLPSLQVDSTARTLHNRLTLPLRNASPRPGAARVAENRKIDPRGGVAKDLTTMQAGG